MVAILRMALGRESEMPFTIFKYSVKEGLLKHSGDLIDDHVPELISTFLQTQIGRGADDSEPEDREVYTIKIDIDLSDDTFTVIDDTGNKGLRDGILLTIALEWEDEVE